MVGTRDTPPSIQDNMPSGQGANMSGLYTGTGDGLTPAMAQQLGRECYQASTSWLNSGRRAAWNDSLRAFQGLHPTNSKYLSNDYRYRSRLFRPKTRSMVRRGEAETAAAFFSNEDVVSISPGNESDMRQVASSRVMKALLQYRLTKTIPWFQTLVGARQDAEVMGICIGKTYWKYAERTVSTEQRPRMDDITGLPALHPETGEPQMDDFDIMEKTADHPWVDLLAPENFRFDAAADWRDPVATSPYLIELVPMYVADVRAKVESREWLPVSESSIIGSTDIDDDVTRRSREQGRVPGKDNDAWKPRQFSLCWVRENIMRWGGTDWHYLTLSSAGELLTNPRPLKEVYLHGVRPYTVGNIVLETHKTHPSGKVELIRDLQMETNDVGNLRLDNVKLAVNPRQFVAEGKGIDPADVKVFNPGKVVMVRDPRADIVWDRPPDVTASAYQEQDRINMDIDELTGGISNSSVQANRQVYESVANMEMMAGNGSQIAEYEQRMFGETFVEKIMRQLVLLEQAYETDEVVLTLAGNDAQLLQKFGINEITDELLQQELTTKVNVGTGATNPEMKMKKFLMAADAIGKMFGPVAAQGANFEEVVKEIFGLCGYKDGSRFFQPGFDPKQAMQQMAQGKPGADDKTKELALKHQQRMEEISTQHQAQMQEAAAESAGQQKDDSLDAQRAVMEMQMKQRLAEQELAMKERLGIMELQSKERIAIAQAHASNSAAAMRATQSTGTPNA